MQSRKETSRPHRAGSGQELEQCDIMTIAGTRPEVIKLTEFVKHFGKENHCYVYTGQHFSLNLSDIFFSELGSSSDINLDCRSSDVDQIASRLDNLFRTARPSVVVVYGDTNSTLAGAMAAKKNNITLVHIEAGLRSFDLRMPEERNRLQVDRLSDHLLCPTSLSAEFLKFEGIRRNVEVTGNLVVDVSEKFSRCRRKGSATKLRDFILLTLHRAETVDDKDVLSLVMSELGSIDENIVFPIHPRTKKNLDHFGISVPPNVSMIDPQGYLDFLDLLTSCKLALTDSGGVQEEACILGKPCITLRHTTERWETILIGANKLYPLLQNGRGQLKDYVSEMKSKRFDRHPYGENVTVRTVESVKKILDGQKNSSAPRS